MRSDEYYFGFWKGFLIGAIFIAGIAFFVGAA